jgi:hypothetical protein
MMKRFLPLILVLLLLGLAGCSACGSKDLTPAETGRASAGALLTAYESAHAAYLQVVPGLPADAKEVAETKVAPLLDRAKPVVVLYGRLAALMTRVDNWRAATAEAQANGGQAPDFSTYVPPDILRDLVAGTAAALGQPEATGSGVTLADALLARSGDIYNLALALISEAANLLKKETPA